MRRVLLVLLVAGCASSKKAGEVDAPPAPPDMAVDALPQPDAPPGKGFGEPCTDNAQCESQLCILVGTSGQCTKLCGDCPDGYGCLGVTGIQIEGQVSFVCVPTSNQLCTPCTQDTECTLLGMDKCVTYPDGDRACARDCTSVTCPVGYDCKTVDIGGTDFKQCIATSDACDCTAANPGQMQPCNIMTPFNVCVGAQTCGGATGWGTCEPPSQTDDPDANFEDSNCDGIDGDRARAIFVAGGGVNSASCGLDFDSPCQTLPFGIARATATGRPHVYVQSGTYATGTLAMANGISVFGGYDFNWRRRPFSEAGHTVTIDGGVIGVKFDSLSAPTTLDNVIVRSANAAGVGASSTAILVTGSSSVELRALLVEPGAGSTGSAGVAGTAGNPGGNGGPGNPGCENSDLLCSSCAQPAGGLAGASSCSRKGGLGGAPGLGGQNGFAGATGQVGTGGGAGATCNSSRNCDGQPGTAGSDGAAGTNGIPGAGFGNFSGTTYLAANGGNGANGAAGNGGGGGGGGGGGTTNCDSFGSSGGGGGGGGCGGTRGTGGTGGGGSFGIIALDSLVVIDGSLINGGSGGAGGPGGSGAGGGLGGLGGAGGPYGGSSEQDDGGDGAVGGKGGKGGGGGDGGGGGGGPSIAVVCLGSSVSTVSVLGTMLLGGTGGAGGVSNAPGQQGVSAMSLGCPF